MAPTKDMLLSSPDPLGMSNGSIPSHSPTKEGRRSLTTPRKALIEASGNAQVQEFYINTPPNPRRNVSPMKSPRQTTHPTSPWRIRLTVQAEQVDEIQRSEISPTKRLTERTTTITVPLKGGDDTPPVVEKKGRGRPRKSLENPVKRAGTPKPKAGGRRKTILESPKKQEVDAHSETATPPKKPRGRPRKSIEPKDTEASLGLPQKNDLDVWLGSSLVGGEETAETRSKIARTKSRGRRQEITPMKIAVDSDIESQSSSAGVAGDVPKELAWTLKSQQGEEEQTDQRSYQSHEALTPQIEQSLVSGTSCGQSALGQQNEDGWRSMINRDTRSRSPHGDDAQDQTEFDPTGQYQEYNSILESEGFSMVSVSSLPSMGDNSVSSPQQYGSLHEHTPTITSSPSVSPAPEAFKNRSSPRQLDIPSDGTPKLAKVVRAGIALQGVLSPKDRSQKLDSSSQGSQKPSPVLAVEEPAPQRELSHRVPKDKLPEERLDDLFRGFGAGTRRELKAGLRLGEELSKRQRQTSQESVAGMKEGDDVFHQTSNPSYPQLPASDPKEGHLMKAPGSERQVRYPLLSNNQLPSPERSLVDEEDDRMSWKADTPIKQEVPASMSAQVLVSDESIGPNASAIDHTMIARKEEWQREREAVSKQIEMANNSQVIVIDSDDEEEEKQDLEEDVADSDIWQAEAQPADQSKETTPEASDVFLQPEFLKPRRSKIPSPWRRNSQVIYSDEVEPTESDLFWQPDQSQARASKRRNARKGKSQDHSDISADSVLDISLENTRKAEAQIQLEASKAWPVESPLLSNDEDSNIATSAEHTHDHGSIQHTDQTTKSPVIVTPSENHAVRELPPTPTTPKEALLKHVIEVSEKITTLKITEGTSVEPILRTSKDSEAAIDPRLLQKKTGPLSVSNRPDRPIRPIRPIQSLQPIQSSTSWLSRLTAPIWSVFAQAASLPPAATKEDILCSSPHEPLCQLTPWEECHFRALGPLYYGSLLYGAHLFPFNPRSPSARYRGAYVTTKLGWSRKITPEDCGITDAFMVLLDERGFALGEPGARWIDEGMVIAMCVALWVGMVKRGEIEVDRSKGERIGLRDQGDKKWTKDDIDWASNESAYFERKRREFDGLPSWKNKA
ncbi:hypothetical protein HO173_002562 [Letharia columbiana]|uniref:Uncharacterized protein n=1 Tax=Letharia columbiana TaxID=112416 RepID=A0A8H6G2E7_9LECA|nr:uncharacterized protein HO173_002562 [Letharia columbiana]KAF6239300.1 hypothetical protein HO173_002562 [Letharia columbiana]